MAEKDKEELIGLINREKQSKWLLTMFFSIIVVVTQLIIYFSDRPNRDEVRTMISEKVNSRFDSIERKLDNIDNYLRK